MVLESIMSLHVSSQMSSSRQDLVANIALIAFHFYFGGLAGQEKIESFITTWTSYLGSVCFICVSMLLLSYSRFRNSPEKCMGCRGFPCCGLCKSGLMIRDCNPLQRHQFRESWRVDFHFVWQVSDSFRVLLSFLISDQCHNDRGQSASGVPS
jgi:hypothetical protein